MKRLVIWNGRAGKAALHQAVLTALGHIDSTSVVDIAQGAPLIPTLSQAVDDGCQTVVVAGGDGTVNAVVNAVMHLEPQRRPQLGIIPLGTANDFAGTLGVPDEIDQAAALLKTSQLMPVDVVRISADHFERFYANVAAGGNSVRVSEELTDEMKAQWGAYCYLRGALNVLSDLDCFRVTAQIDDEQFRDIGTWAVLVANGRTNAGRIVVAPQASCVDGLLDVVIIRDGSVLGIVDLVSRALLGSYLESEQVIYRQAKTLKLHSVPGMRFTIDGEVIDEEPVQFEVIPGAIRMFASSQFWVEHSHALRATSGAADKPLGMPAGL